MNDLISRQAAINAICEDGTRLERQGKYSITMAERKQRDADILGALPSAQPEIIRCKDCRWGKEVCGNIECFADINVPPEYHGYDWFCPNGERRTDG